MEEQVHRLVTNTWEKFRTVDASSRLLIAIGGIPGSGKTTLAQKVVSDLNHLHHKAFHETYPNAPEADQRHPDPSQPDVAIHVPLDGYHLTRKQLSEMPNAEEAIFRRGAAFTFDAQAYFKLVEQLRQPLEATTPTIYAPSFDHAIKDPVENDIPIPPSARIIVLEGNYVVFDQKPWSDAAELMDELWFVDVDYNVAMERVVKRAVAAGISPDINHAVKRAKESDMRNGREILDHKLKVHETIRSMDDDYWKPVGVKLMEEKHEMSRPVHGRKDSLLELAESGAGC